MLRTLFQRLFKGAPIKLEVGAQCPAFRALNTEGVFVTEADLKGKRTVLWFYPRASTPG